MMRIVDVIDLGSCDAVRDPDHGGHRFRYAVHNTGAGTYLLGQNGTYRTRTGAQLENSEFVLAAKTLGASTGRIFVKHLIPNMMGTIMVAIAMQIPNAISPRRS